MTTAKPETIAAQAGGGIDAATGAIVPPIHLATTFQRDPDNQYRLGYGYGRPDNATVRRTEAVIAALEGGSDPARGEPAPERPRPECLLFASGMAAATALFLSLPRPAHVVAPHVMYWALRHWLAADGPGFGLETTFVDATNPSEIEGALRPGRTRLVWLETPANPTWIVSDIAGTAALAHGAGALLAVDSTVATPVLTQPLGLGADIVMHSATKYLNGHSDVLAGALVFAKRDDTFERAAMIRRNLGAILGPFEASLLLRGLRTLYVRVRHQSAAALGLAQRFVRHERVAEVLYPGLAGNRGHNIAARQMRGGHGGMLSIRIAGGEAAAIRAAANVELWKRATSLGGVESLIEHRASIEGPGSPCPPDLLRLSVGLEDVGDLFDDLDRALRA